MFKRIITAIVALSVLVPVLVYSDTPAFVILCSFISCMCVYEMLGCIGCRKNHLCSLANMAFAALIPVTARYTSVSENFFGFFSVFSFLLILYMLIISVFSNRYLSVDLSSVSLVTTVYITFGVSSLIILRDMEYGGYIYLLAFLIPWISDTFAYFIGSKFGRHKLIPSVSPHKSVEGAAAGVVFSCLFTLLYGLIVGEIFDVTPNIPMLAITGAAVSFISQCGDLIMSLFKRRFNIKDYGRILPGHGGLLDRFDSILAAAPFLLILILFTSTNILFR